MRVLPIPFSDNMVLAIQRGHKTQTRRLMRPQPTPTPIGWRFVSEDAGFGWSGEPPMDYFSPLCPFGVPGDTLFVQEAFGIAVISFDPAYVQVGYRSSGKDIKIPGWHRATEFVSPELTFSWCEPKRMPRWASRFRLLQTGGEVGAIQLDQHVALLDVLSFGERNRGDLAIDPGFENNAFVGFCAPYDL